MSQDRTVEWPAGRDGDLVLEATGHAAVFRRVVEGKLTGKPIRLTPGGILEVEDTARKQPIASFRLQPEGEIGPPGYWKHRVFWSRNPTHLEPGRYVVTVEMVGGPQKQTVTITNGATTWARF